jgi:hypothetical protein
LDMYTSISYAPRQKCLAMISIVDEGIANVTAALKAKDMYDNTFVIFSSVSCRHTHTRNLSSPSNLVAQGYHTLTVHSTHTGLPHTHCTHTGLPHTHCTHKHTQGYHTLTVHSIHSI